ncbi:6527_t:CDS:2, partial [Diversispora eburnea]
NPISNLIDNSINKEGRKSNQMIPTPPPSTTPQEPIIEDSPSHPIIMKKSPMIHNQIPIQPLTTTSTSSINTNTSIPPSIITSYLLPANVVCLPRTNQIDALLTIIRDKATARGDFIFHSDRIIRLLVEEGNEFKGIGFKGQICGVSIMRAGEAMEQGLRECCRSVRIGKILIQRDEETAQPKLPPDIESRYVLLLDPMLATGGSAIKAIEVLLSNGVAEEKILFLNLLAAPEGVTAVTSKFSKLKIITAFIDEGLDDKKYIVPGLGDFDLE